MTADRSRSFIGIAVDVGVSVDVRVCVGVGVDVRVEEGLEVGEGENVTEGRPIPATSQPVNNPPMRRSAAPQASL